MPRHRLDLQLERRRCSEPSSSNIIVPPLNEFEFTTLTATTPDGAATANAANISSADPDINFLAIVKGAMELEETIENDSYPVIIIGEWYRTARPKDLTRYSALKTLCIPSIPLSFNRFRYERMLQRTQTGDHRSLRNLPQEKSFVIGEPSSSPWIFQKHGRGHMEQGGEHHLTKSTRQGRCSLLRKAYPP